MKNTLFITGLLFVLSATFAIAQNENTTIKPAFLELSENKGQWTNEILFRGQANCFDLHIGSNYINYYFYNQKQWASAIKHPHKGEKLDSINVDALKLTMLHALKPLASGINKQKHYLNYFIGNNIKKWASNISVYHGAELKEIYKGITLKYLTTQNLKYEFWLEPNANLADIQIEITGATDLKIEYGDLFISLANQTIREQKPFAYQYINGEQVQVLVNFKLTNNVLSYHTPNGYNKNYGLIIDPSLVFLTYSGSTVDNFGFTATPGENGTLYAGGIATGPYNVNPTGKYPTQAGSFQQVFAGGRDDLLTENVNFPCDITLSKYSSDGTTLLWSTYFGGANANEYPHSLVMDNDSNLVVMGTTSSNDFPVTPNAFDTSYNGNLDIVVFKLSKDGTQLIGSTYIGDTENDGYNYNGITNYFYADGFRGDVTCNAQNEIFVASVTNSTKFPTTPGVIKDTISWTQDGVVFKLNNDLSNLEWSTYFGGNNIDALYSIDFGKDGNIYLAGGTNSSDLPATAGTIQSTNAFGRADGFVSVITANGKIAIRTTYWGTGNYDQIFSLELDQAQNIYVVGHSLGNMPVSGNVYQNPNGRQFISSFTNDLKQVRWSTVFGAGRANIDLTINAFLVDECGRIYVSGWGGNTSNTGTSSTYALKTTTGAFQETTDGSDFYLMLLNKEAKNLLYATFLGGNQNTGEHVDGGTSRFDKRGVVYQSMCASCPIGIPPTPISDLATTPNSYAPINTSPRCSNAALKFDFRIENAAFDYTVDTCASIFSFKNQTVDAANFYWIFANGDTSTEENPKKYIPPSDYGKTITLIVEFGTNCADTAYGTVNITDTLNEVVIPNVFTPNSDNINDEFMILGASDRCDEAEVFIYNRWGQLFFHSKSPDFKWDGKSTNGVLAQEGVYFVILKVKKQSGKDVEFHSTLTLIR